MGRILVADDEEGIREYLVEALELAGHTVAAEPDGRAAAARLDREGFDLLLTDLKMPGLDGMQLLKKVRAEQPDLQVIMLTAHGTIETAVEAMKLGAADYLRKPIGSLAELRLVVARALERRALINLRAQTNEEGAPLSWGDASMARVEQALRKVARTKATVLLTGESGVGKEVAARKLHQWSDRAEGPFSALNCAALTETLLESELFGHEKGAFTGADRQHRGAVEVAAGGTFFLDEIGELAKPLQAKLLRVLQEGTYRRVGGTRVMHAEVRWVAATNRDLPALIAAGGFREDLYHRLAVFPIRLPALRERPGDFDGLCGSLLRRVAAEVGVPPPQVSPEAMAQLRAAPWPGNIRELRNTLERALILGEGGRIEVADLWLEARATTPERLPELPLAALERRAIEEALERSDGNRRVAAEALGIGLRTLYEKLKRYER